MFTGAKYIVFETDTGKIHPTLFPRAIKHSAFARMMPEHYKPVSAGFVTMGLECFGESTSLGLPSLEGDTLLVRNIFKSDAQLTQECMESLYSDEGLSSDQKEPYEQDD